MGDEPLVGIVLLNWNGWRFTLGCLASLDSIRYRNKKVLIVDNASSDESVKHLREARPDDEILVTEKNLGFAGGCNVGIRKAAMAKCEYVWLLNNDAIADPLSLSELVELASKDPGVGAVGSILYDPPEAIRVQSWGGGRVHDILGHARHVTAPGRIDYITGASMLLRVEMLRNVGMLDEGFFMYWEDADLCVRMRKQGWRIAVADGSHITHKKSSTVSQGSHLQAAYANASAVRFFMLHSKAPWIPILIGAALRGTRRALAGRPDLSVVIIGTVLKELWRWRFGQCVPGVFGKEKPLSSDTDEGQRRAGSGDPDDARQRLKEL